MSLPATAYPEPVATPYRQERRRQPLESAVRIAMERYLEQLDGHSPEQLHGMVMEAVERPLLQTVMRHAGGNQSKAAQYLGVNRATLRKKLKHHGLE